MILPTRTSKAIPGGSKRLATTSKQAAKARTGIAPEEKTLPASSSNEKIITDPPNELLAQQAMIPPPRNSGIQDGQQYVIHCLKASGLIRQATADIVEYSEHDMLSNEDPQVLHYPAGLDDLSAGTIVGFFQHDRLQHVMVVARGAAVLAGIDSKGIVAHDCVHSRHCYTTDHFILKKQDLRKLPQDMQVRYQSIETILQRL